MTSYSNYELYHFGIKGQKWGLRRFQNEDGSYKPGAEGRYYQGYSDTKGSIYGKRTYRKAIRETNKTYRANKRFINKSKDYTDEEKRDLKSNEKYLHKQALKDIKNDYSKTTDAQISKEKMKKAAVVGAALIGTALVAYGAYKVSNNMIANKNTAKYYAKGKKYTERLKKMESKYTDYAKKSESFAKGTGKNDYTKHLQYMEKARKAKAKADKYYKKSRKSIDALKKINTARSRGYGA